MRNHDSLPFMPLTLRQHVSKPRFPADDRYLQQYDMALNWKRAFANEWKGIMPLITVTTSPVTAIVGGRFLGSAPESLLVCKEYIRKLALLELAFLSKDTSHDYFFDCDKGTYVCDVMVLDRDLVCALNNKHGLLMVSIHHGMLHSEFSASSNDTWKDDVRQFLSQHDYPLVRAYLDQKCKWSFSLGDKASCCDISVDSQAAVALFRSSSEELPSLVLRDIQGQLYAVCRVVTSDIHACAISSDGSLVALMGDKGVQIYHFSSLQCAGYKVEARVTDADVRMIPIGLVASKHLYEAEDGDNVQSKYPRDETGMGRISVGVCLRLLVGPTCDPTDVDTTNEQRNQTTEATAAEREILPRSRSQV